MNKPDDLREEYRGVEAILPEISVIVLGGEVVHRPSPDGETPACSAASAAWSLAETENALRVGMVPCRACWASVCDYLAGEPDSPIERRGEGVPDLDADVNVGELIADGAGDLIKQATTLTTRPEEVLITSGSAKRYYHAPGKSGPLCGRRGDFRRVDRAVLAGHADPCRECFDIDALDDDQTDDADGTGCLCEHGQHDMPRLVDYPEVVLATTGGTKRYHAPTEEGPACGTDADHRRGKREALEPHYQPCADCFDVEEIEERRDRVIR